MLATLLVALLVVGADPPKQKEFSPEAKKELKKFEGKWQLVKGLSNGEEGDLTQVEAFALFEGSKVTLFKTGSDRTESLEISAIDSSTDPKCIDLLEKRQGRPDRLVESVYKIDGRKLFLALGLSKEGKFRPVSFDKPKDQRTMVWVLERAKE